ncbi:MAG TPA: choice-of-anchor Q domain-containing protein [Dokdonella sp.]
MQRLLAVILSPVVFASPAAAATFTVTSLADSGPGSLRAAVESANATPGGDTIRFQAALAGTISLAAEILVSDALVVEGPGPEALTLSGAGSHRIFVLDRASGARTTTLLSGLAFEDGQATDGGAIFAEDEDLVVRNAVFRNNASVSRGGAIRLAAGDLTLEDVALVDNQAGPGINDTGGAIHHSNGRFRMTRGVVQGNRADYGGGFYFGTPAPDVVIEDSVFIDNASHFAGGAINAGTTMPSFRVARSSFIGNSTQEPLGAAISFGGSTGAGSAPGVIENSTFSGNFTPHAGGRGIVAVNSGTLYLRNSTLAYNRTATQGSATAGDGGAVWVGGATLHIDSTLFSHNTHGTDAAFARVDLSPSSSPLRILNVSRSLLHTTPPGGLVNGVDSENLFDTDADLLPLVVEGEGFAPVHPLPATSPAIDAGSNPASLATDQRGRGHPRTVDLVPCRHPSFARTDIGAYELRTDTIFCHGFES